MLLQSLDMNSDSNMSTQPTEYEQSLRYELESKKNTNTTSLSPLTDPFTSSDKRTIFALPPLTTPSSNSGSSNSGIYSLFSSTSFSSSSVTDKSTPYILNGPKPQPFVPNGPTNKSYHQQHVGMHQGMEMPQAGVSPMHMMGTNDPLEAVLGTFPCARIRGLPFNARLDDVLVFFQGLVVLDVVLVPQYYGQTSGEGFIVFGNPMDFQMAMQRNRQPMGHRYIEVYRGKRSDYYAAVASQFSHHQGDGAGEVGGSAPQELQQQQGNVWTAPGVPEPQTQAMMAPMQKAQVAGKPPAHHTASPFKGTSLSNNRSGRGDNIRPKGAGRGNGRGGGIQVGEHTGYLRMRGLPFTSTKKEIAQFFSEYNPIEDSICLTYRSDGRATGEGYISFQKPDDAKNAMTLHRNTMGSRYIELFISNKEEHGRALARETVLR